MNENFTFLADLCADRHQYCRVLLVLLLIRSYVRQRLEIQASRDQLTVFLTGECIRTFCLWKSGMPSGRESD
jgi:hypothetical protein